MRIEIQTNTTPIIVGDEIGIVIHPDGWDWTNMWYSLHLGPRTLATLSPFNPHYDWTVDAFGTAIVIRATAHGAFGLTKSSVFTAPFTILPDPPRLTAPGDDELLSAGSDYTFRWDQNPPHADAYRILFSADAGATFQQLGQDASGGSHSASRVVPAGPTDDGRVRLEGIFPGFPASFREETKVRTTSAPVVTVVRPPAHAIWHLGDEATIKWEAGGQIDSFKIQLSRDTGHTWTTLASNVAGDERQIVVPVDPPASEHCEIRIDAQGPTGSGSDRSGLFRIRHEQ
jgi:hypothetical protein